MIAIAFLFVRLLYDCFKSPALPPKAEVHPRSRYVAKVPATDIQMLIEVRINSAPL
jgi:hypothetical protein